MSVFELPKLAHPDFAVKPRVVTTSPTPKPTGNLKIDRNNEFGKHVIRAFIPSHGIPLDIVSGPMSPTSGATIVDGEIANFNDTAGNQFDYDDHLPGSQEFSILTKVKRDTETSYDTIYSEADNTNWNVSGIDWHFKGAGGTSSFYFRLNNVNTSKNESFVGTGVWFNATAVWSPAVYRVYVNNSQRANNGSPPATWVESDRASKIGTYHSASQGQSFDGQMEYMVILDYAVTKEEDLRFHSDPYQILEPQVPLYLVVPEVVAAGFVPQPRNMDGGMNQIQGGMQ